LSVGEVAARSSPALLFGYNHLLREGDQEFKSASLQRQVTCEPDSPIRAPNISPLTGRTKDCPLCQHSLLRRSAYLRDERLPALREFEDKWIASWFHDQSARCAEPIIRSISTLSCSPIAAICWLAALWLAAIGFLCWPVMCGAQMVGPTPQPQGIPVTPEQAERVQPENWAVHGQGGDRFHCPLAPWDARGPAALVAQRCVSRSAVRSFIVLALVRSCFI
jgi:hypothetical protein